MTATMTKEGIQWHPSVEKARGVVDQSGKLMLIEVFSSKCEGCKAMASMTFSNSEVERYIEQYFIPVHFDIIEQPEVMEQFNTPWTPTLIVQDAAGREHQRSQGYLAPQRFLGEMSLARVKEALNRKDFQSACDCSLEAMEQTQGDLLREPEAYYWAAVADYKASGDQNRLAAGWNYLLDMFPESEWAYRAEFIRDDPQINTI